MAGRLIEVVGKQTFSLYFNSGTTPTVVLGNRVFDVRDATSGVLVVRAAAASGVPSPAYFQINMINAAVMPDDPATLYVSNGALAAAVPVAYVQPTSNGLWLASFTASSTPPCGATVAFTLQAIWSGSPSPSLATVTMGVELLLRDT